DARPLRKAVPADTRGGTVSHHLASFPPMLANRRRWQSIDKKLPLQASAIVLVTLIVLGWTAYVLLERALIDATGKRLLTTATTVAQLVYRPSTHVSDSAGRAGDGILRAFIRGKATREAALAELTRALPGDTTRFYAAIIDSAGR